MFTLADSAAGYIKLEKVPNSLTFGTSVLGDKKNHTNIGPDCVTKQQQIDITYTLQLLTAHYQMAGLQKKLKAWKTSPKGQRNTKSKAGRLRTGLKTAVIYPTSPFRRGFGLTLYPLLPPPLPPSYSSPTPLLLPSYPPLTPSYPPPTPLLPPSTPSYPSYSPSYSPSYPLLLPPTPLPTPFLPPFLPPSYSLFTPLLPPSYPPPLLLSSSYPLPTPFPTPLLPRSYLSKPLLTQFIPLAR